MTGSWPNATSRADEKGVCFLKDFRKIKRRTWKDRGKRRKGGGKADAKYGRKKVIKEGKEHDKMVTGWREGK